MVYRYDQFFSIILSVLLDGTFQTTLWLKNWHGGETLAVGLPMEAVENGLTHNY